jgi:isoquinoline 1-oxidoreductase beta subunit
MIWSREDDIKGGYYRPSHVHRADIGWMPRAISSPGTTSSSASRSWPARRSKPSWSRTASTAPWSKAWANAYDVPMNLTAHTAKANVPVLWWRSVGSTHTAFVMETLIDEAAHAAGIDPVAYRKKLIDAKHVRHHAALDLAVAKSGYGKKALPKGHAYGVAVHESFNTVVAYVVEASVKDGAPKLHKVTAGVHCNLAVNPLSIEAQIQGAALMAWAPPAGRRDHAEGWRGRAAELQRLHGGAHERHAADRGAHRAVEGPADRHGRTGPAAAGAGLRECLFKLTGKRLRKLPFDLASA